LTPKPLATKTSSKSNVTFLSTSSTTATATYTVQKSDTLYSLAKRFVTTVTELKTLNGLKSDTIYVGQGLKIPATNNVTSYALILGPNDPTSFYIQVNGKELPLETSYGAGELYAKTYKSGTYATVTYKLRDNNMPAFVSIR